MFLFTIIYFIITFFACSWFVHFLPGSVTHLFETLAHIFFTIAAAYLTLPTAKKLFYRKRVTSYDKAVLITGCDTGFGHELAKRLDAHGFRVFAACLFPVGQGAEILKKTSSSRLSVLGLDVTDVSSIKEALGFITNNLNGHKLWAVVNNAGILHTGYGIEWSSLENYQDVLNINVMGAVRITKAFLPLLRKSEGRIITVTSITVNFTSVPYFSPYVMSKVALSAFCDCLRQEMKVWGVKVICIEPAAFRTPLVEWQTIKKRTEESIKYVDEAVKKDYGEGYFNDFLKTYPKFKDIPSTHISMVVNDLYDAISLVQPSYTYKSCRNVFFKFIFNVTDLLPKPFLEFFMYILFRLALSHQTGKQKNNQHFGQKVSLFFQ